MPIVFYDLMVVISLVLALVYALIWHKHFDVNLTMIFFLIPVANIGYSFMARAENIREAIIGSKVIYLGGCFLPLFITLAIFGICKINMPRAVRVLMFFMSIMSYGSVLTIGYNKWFYKAIEQDFSNGYLMLQKTYGPMHTVYYIFIIIYLIMGISVLVYSLIKRSDVSHRIILLLFIPETISIFSYFANKIFQMNIELVPVTYVMAQVVFLIIAYRMGLYDINDSAIDSIVEKGSTGFASFDLDHRFLGANSTACRMLPFLEGLHVDKVVKDERIDKWVAGFEKNSKADKIHYRQDDKIYLIDINHLVSARRKVGYQLLITDDTQDQKYLEMLEHFNTKLEQEVKAKTEHIVEMHDNLILSMATMVESRDNSTGGHIRRTSVCVRYLIEAMREGGYEGLTDSFCEKIIKAAPMHDLGKIAVDDAVLRYEGRYTPEMHNEMKKHAAEGARIVHEILKDTDDMEFHLLAENVAHYHHERWDGSGYPEGLKGRQIPLEARIMAIADVYDALVSKRCYKDSMPFDKADAIIMEGMGTQFDKSLEKYYVAARPKLEEYYRGLQSE